MVSYYKQVITKKVSYYKKWPLIYLATRKKNMMQIKSPKIQTKVFIIRIVLIWKFLTSLKVWFDSHKKLENNFKLIKSWTFSHIICDIWKLQIPSEVGFKYAITIEIQPAVKSAVVLRNFFVKFRLNFLWTWILWTFYLWVVLSRQY